MRARSSLCAVLLLSALAAPVAAQAPAAPPRLDSVELPAELDRVLRDYERAWSAGDAEALASLFTAAGHVSNPAGWIRGPDAIRQQYSNASGDLRLRAVHYALGDSVAFVVGAYGYGEGAATRDMGKFVLALERGTDGRWLIAADLDNTNRPPTAN